MSIALLEQVYEETRRLAVAGSAVAPGDFRLKKVLPPLEQSGAKSAVFLKLAEATRKLLDSDERTASGALLELGTLINAVLYTQGETDIKGKVEPLVSSSMGLSRTQTAASLLAPLIEALTSTGSGRMEIIRDAFERGLFLDLRLVRPALQALDDNYKEIADFISEKIIPIYGVAIFPELESQFDPKGKAGQARRLQTMYRLSAQRARKHVEAALEEGTKEVRVAAIECLGDSPEDVPFLLEQSAAKNKDVRRAAFTGLSRAKDSKALAAIQNSISGKHLEDAILAILSCDDRSVAVAVVEAASAQLKKITEFKGQEKKQQGKLVERLLLLLQCLGNRTDSDSEAFILSLFDRREQLAAIKSEPGGADVVDEVARLMSCGTALMKRTLADAENQLPQHLFRYAVEAAIDVYEPEAFFDLFAPSVIRESASKKLTGNKAKRRDAIFHVLVLRNGGWNYYGVNREITDDAVVQLSARWLDVALSEQNFELLVSLVKARSFRGEDRKVHTVLSQAMEVSIASSKDPYQPTQLLTAMVVVSHPDVVDAFVAILRKFHTTRTYHLRWLTQVISQLPRDEAIEKIQPLLPSIDEQTAAQVIDELAYLKNL